MIKLYCEHYNQTLNRLDDESVQAVFIDPPYGISATAPLRRPEGGFYNGMANVSWDSPETANSWQDAAPALLSELHRVLKPNGTGFLCGTYHNIFDMGVLLHNLGFWVLNKIIWVKTNPVPNLSGARLCASYEEIIWFKRSQRSPYKFNYQEMKKYNDGKQLRDVWIIGTASGRERVRNPLSGKIAHPSQKPLELLFRLLEMATDRGDLVFDPFAGMGTSLVAASRLNRHAVGAEIDTAYAYMAQERINEYLRHSEIVGT